MESSDTENGNDDVRLPEPIGSTEMVVREPGDVVGKFVFFLYKINLYFHQNHYKNDPLSYSFRYHCS